MPLLLPSPTLYPGTVYPVGVDADTEVGDATVGVGTVGVREDTVITIHVRDKPPLRITTEACTPSGRRYRWASDEPDPASVPSGQRHSDTMPGGFEQYGATLPRKPGIDYADLERLTTITVRGAGGRVVGEYRLDSAPRTSGDQMAVSPAAVGYQAALEDNKFARGLYVDRDLSHWGEISRTLQLSYLGSSQQYFSPSTAPDTQNGLPALVLETGDSDTSVVAEAVYDAGSERVASLYYDVAWNTAPAATPFDASWVLHAVTCDTDDRSTAVDTGTDHITGAGNSSAATTWTPTTARRFLFVSLDRTGTLFKGPVRADWRRVAVFGDHGLTKRGSAPDEGFYASDIVAHAVQTWAPSLNTEVQQSSFIIPHLAFMEPTTAGEIVRQASRFDLPDWAVWENRTFWWTERGGQARRWRARIGPSELEETGPQVDRLWESIVVQYNDVDGSTRTVGPPGSGANTESADLKDYDPDNPANKAGLTRRDLLAMGTSTAAGATEVGRRFLVESRLLDRSGKARAVGYVEDDRGVVHPYWAPRAGDEIAFVDASDKSYRRIVRTDKDHDSRTVSFDLDAPPEGLQQLLERLGVVLVPLSLGS